MMRYWRTRESIRLTYMPRATWSGVVCAIKPPGNRQMDAQSTVRTGMLDNLRSSHCRVTARIQVCCVSVDWSHRETDTTASPGPRIMLSSHQV